MQDPFEKNVPGVGLSREPEPTPMQREPSPNAGSTTGTRLDRQCAAVGGTLAL